MLEIKLRFMKELKLREHYNSQDVEAVKLFPDCKRENLQTCKPENL
jgi:hypothetical protein